MKPLALYRKEKSLSQCQLSEQITELGTKISPASVAMYETGKRQPPLAKARAIAQFFGVTTDDIEYGKSDRGE
ncbi:MAG: helix-turn-helix transcriptional regulator [Syntrophomonas sp.]